MAKKKALKWDFHPVKNVGEENNVSSSKTLKSRRVPSNSKNNEQRNVDIQEVANSRRARIDTCGHLNRPNADMLEPRMSQNELEEMIKQVESDEIANRGKTCAMTPVELKYFNRSKALKEQVYSLRGKIENIENKNTELRAANKKLEDDVQLLNSYKHAYENERLKHGGSSKPVDVCKTVNDEPKYKNLYIERGDEIKSLRSELIKVQNKCNDCENLRKVKSDLQKNKSEIEKIKQDFNRRLKEKEEELKKCKEKINNYDVLVTDIKNLRLQNNAFCVENEKLKYDCLETQRKYSKIKEDNDVLRNSNQFDQSIIAELTDEISKIQRNLQEKSAELEAFVNKAKITENELNKQIKSLNDEIKSGNDRLQCHIDEIKKFKQSESKLRSELKAKDEKIAQLNAVISENISGLDMAQSYENQKILLENKLRGLENENQLNLIRIHELEEQKKSIINNRDALQGDVLHLSEDLKAQTRLLDEKCEEIERNSAKAVEIESRLNNELDKLRISLEDNRTLLDQRDAEIRRLQNELDVVEEARDRLLSEKDSSIRELESQMHSSDSTWQSRVDDLNTKITEQTRLLSEKDSSIRELEEQLKEYVNYQSDCESLKSALQVQEELVVSLRAENEAAIASQDSLRSQVESLLQKCDEQSDCESLKSALQAQEELVVSLRSENEAALASQDALRSQVESLTQKCDEQSVKLTNNDETKWQALLEAKETEITQLKSTLAEKMGALARAASFEILLKQTKENNQKLQAELKSKQDRLSHLEMLADAKKAENDLAKRDDQASIPVKQDTKVIQSAQNVKSEDQTTLNTKLIIELRRQLKEQLDRIANQNVEILQLKAKCAIQPGV